MKSSAVTAAVLVVVGTGAALPGAQAARPDAARPVASTVVLVDGAGDVWTYSDTTTGVTPATRPDADVLRARISVGDQDLRIRTTFDDLRRNATQWYRVTVRTPGDSYWYVLEATKGHWSGRMYRDLDGEWVDAPGVAHAIDYAADVVTWRIPYDVLGDPAWVQVRVRNDLGLPDGSTFFTDNPATHSDVAVFTGRLGLP
jgi:hypothetical protein